jgi:hypothetical protein
MFAHLSNWRRQVRRRPRLAPFGDRLPQVSKLLGFDALTTGQVTAGLVLSPTPAYLDTRVHSLRSPQTGGTTIARPRRGQWRQLPEWAPYTQQDPVSILPAGEALARLPPGPLGPEGYGMCAGPVRRTRCKRARAGWVLSLPKMTHTGHGYGN